MTGSIFMHEPGEGIEEQGVQRAFGISVMEDCSCLIGIDWFLTIQQ